MPEKTDFGLVLARLRRLRPGLSQRTLSTLSNLGLAMVGQYESGEKKNPERETVLKLASGLGASRSELVELLRAAGHLKPGEGVANPDRPSLEVFLRGDPDLTKEQRQTLLSTYEQFIRLNRGQR